MMMYTNRINLGSQIWTIGKYQQFYYFEYILKWNSWCKLKGDKHQAVKLKSSRTYSYNTPDVDIYRQYRMEWCTVSWVTNDGSNEKQMEVFNISGGQNRARMLIQRMWSVQSVINVKQLNDTNCGNVQLLSMWCLSSW